MQIDLDAVIAWAKMWQLSIYINKTNLLHISAKNARHIYQNIVAEESVKDLGVHIIPDLSRSVEVNKVVKHANRITNVFLHAYCRCHNIDLYTLAFVIYARLNILDYYNYVWKPVLCRGIDAIDNV